MATNTKTPKGSKDVESKETSIIESTETIVTETPAEVTATAIPQDVTVPVEGVVTTDGKPKVSKKDDIPEHLKKGNRVCAACLTPEADFLAKNPRYSLCQGVDVLCYRKGHRVIYNQTLEQVQAKYPDKVGVNDENGSPLISSISGIGLKPGILVRGAIKYSRKAETSAVTPAQTAGTATPSEATTATATPVSAAAESGTGSAGTTSAG